VRELEAVRERHKRPGGKLSALRRAVRKILTEAPELPSKAIRERLKSPEFGETIVRIFDNGKIEYRDDRREVQSVRRRSFNKMVYEERDRARRLAR
jgi:hypothetical protein